MDQISQIKQNLNIVDIIGGYLELKKAGRNYKANCPFHGEKTPSFMVSPDLQIYRCFGCGESGDMFEFVKKIEGIEFWPAAEILAEKAGITLEKQRTDPDAAKKRVLFEINEASATFYEYILTKHAIGRKALEYVKKDRKLKPETIKSFRVGYAPDKWDSLYSYLKKRGYKEEDIEAAGLITKSRRGTFIDKFRNRVMFPLIEPSNQVVGFTGRALGDGEPKYLNSPETLIFHKSIFLYGMNEARVSIKTEGAVFVEGQMDVISAHQAGIKNVIATSGTSLTNPQLKILKRYTEELVFCFDADSAGISATLRAIELAEKQNFNIKVAKIPDQYKDIDELIAENKNKAKKILEDAISIYDFFIISAIKKHDQKTAYGKKKIVEEVAPQLAKIGSEVVREHHIKQLAKELNLDENTIEKIINENEPMEKLPEMKASKAKAMSQTEERSMEEYILALLFYSELELAQQILFKLGKKDFTNEENRDIFISLKDYIRPRKKQFKAQHFIKKLNSNLKERAEELYLWDLEDLPNNTTALQKEVEYTFKRLKKDTINRELKILQEEIKKAEWEQDADLIENLSKKVYKISRLKKKYE